MKKQKVGEGKFGKVFKIEENGQIYAVKEISFLDGDGVQNRDIFNKAKREEKMMVSVKHKHIVKLIRTSIEVDKLKIVMEFSDQGSLSQFVRKAVQDPKLSKNFFDEENVWRFLGQVASALDYLHRNKQILHRDLKVTF